MPPCGCSSRGYASRRQESHPRFEQARGRIEDLPRACRRGCPAAGEVRQAQPACGAATGRHAGGAKRGGGRMVRAFEERRGKDIVPLEALKVHERCRRGFRIGIRPALLVIGLCDLARRGVRAMSASPRYAGCSRHAKPMRLCWAHDDHDPDPERPRSAAPQAGGARGAGRDVVFRLPPRRNSRGRGTSDRGRVAPTHRAPRKHDALRAACRSGSAGT